MQSQTTFVGLYEDEGLLLPRVKRQKIWVEGVSYELQEIYGMEQAAGSARPKEVGSGRANARRKRRRDHICSSQLG